MSVPHPSPRNEYIQLHFSPKWRYIATTRNFIQSFLAVSLSNEEKADKLAMAASELLENAVKYSKNQETVLELEVDAETNRIRITASNKGDAESIAAIKSIFEKASTGDPLTVYVEAMKEAAVRTDGKSQLGLVRIRYETGAELKLDVDDDQTVSISLLSD